MKKWVYVLVAMLLAFSMTACTQPTGNPPASPPITPETETPAYNVEYPTFNGEPFISYFSGFTSEIEGWFVGSTGNGAGMQYNYIFLTHNGGETWEEVENLNNVWAHMITCAIFIDKEIGFLCYRYDTENIGRVFRTEDGGKIWRLLDIPAATELLCSGLNSGVGEVRDICILGEKCLEMTFYGRLVPESDPSQGQFYTSISTDFGKTWSKFTADTTPPPDRQVYS